jgi:hypothetical protein
MPSHRPYEFVPVDVPITWRRRLLGGAWLTILIKLILWAGVIYLITTGWGVVILAFVALCMYAYARRGR